MIRKRRRWKAAPSIRLTGLTLYQEQTTTVCPYCGVGCNLTVHEQDGKIVKVTSPLDHDVTHGNLCIKGRFGWQFVEITPADRIRPNGSQKTK